ncbi:MAG TPA: chromosome segregation protein SMC [Candidatus Binatia bacterium]|nr:chromosome segregation protein SMC [Candidatus Binatia bacterium]
MRLKRLEMVGFKSFAQKTVVELNPGITAVVGPNGCGKSNIVDALRWAMGEQSARHLRGQHMEDVVFNGSESLPQTGMAEVSIIFDNEEGRGPTDYSNFSEIMITRRLFRSGDSEYAINKIPCRLKDVVEFFLGTGIGSKAYSIVEQGRVDELVNSKPEDRRLIIEEAAGTSKYKSRKLVAERKLERTQQNLLRVTDIVREIERQIRSMELQAKKAERYRALKAELKEKDLACAVLQRNAFNEEITEKERNLADTEERLAGHLANLHSREAESEAVRLALMEAEREIQEQQENVYQQKVKFQTQEQARDFTGKELSQLGQSEAHTRAVLAQLEEKAIHLAREIEELGKAKESFVQLSLFEQNFLEEKELVLKGLEERMRVLELDQDRVKAALIEAANRIAYLRNDILAHEKRRAEIEGDLARNREESSQATVALAQARQKSGEAKSALEISLDQARECGLEAAQAQAAAQTLAKAKQEQEANIAALKEQLQENRSRLMSLEDLQKNYEGCQEGVRAIMLKKQQAAAPNGIHGLVADVLEAPETYEKALTAVLGDRVQYVIVKGQEEGVEAVEYLKQQASGRGSFIPVQLSRKQSKPLPVGEAEVVAPLLEVISVKEGYRDVAEYLLNDVVLVKDLKSGLELWSRNGYYSTLVTPDGEVIDPMGIVTGGSETALEGSFLTQRRRIRELKEILGGLESQLLQEQAELVRIKRSLEEAETRRSQLHAELHRLELERVRLEHEHLAAEGDSGRLAMTVHTLRQEESDLSATLESINNEIERCRSESGALAQEKTDKENTLAETQTAVRELRDTLETLEKAVTESRIRHAALGEKREHTDQNLEDRLKQQSENIGQIAVSQAQIADLERRKAATQSALIRAEEELDASGVLLRELEENLAARRQSYRAISMNLAELEETIKEVRPLCEACQQEKNGLQLALAEKRLNYQHLADTIRDKYETDLTELAADSSDDFPLRDDLLVEIDELRARLERMGEVNLAAIGEYEELTTRFQFMTQQKEDLEKSIADLQQTIVKLNRVCRLRFKESFEAINEKFESIFPRLFRGGKAKLVLTDENDYLETGIDIVVQPPGKKLQSITLLSGGEKALTAVSLLFAIFLTKPSPFCFLDEVDAPLDDANLDRFNDMVKEMSEHSQFVIVTHNKKTMQAAEVLYGITMAEPGVSKLVSVRMN